MAKPITPKDVVKAKQESLPDAVIESFNAAIAAKWNGHSATILQDDIALTIADVMQIPKQDVFDKHYLDVEAVYKKSGWKVVYEKPGYNEEGPATFTFSK